MTTAHESDDALIARVILGESRAFDTLMRRYQPLALDIAHRLVRNRADAAEIVQDSFLRVWHNITRFEGGASFRTWLYRIVQNRAIDFLRKRRAFGPVVELDDHALTHALTGLPMRVSEPPDEALDRATRIRAVRDTLDDLSRDHRVALVLREVYGCTYAEIASIEEIPEGTVMSRLFLARQRLHAILPQPEEPS